MCLPIEKLKEDKDVPHTRARRRRHRAEPWQASDAMRCVRDVHEREPCGALVWVGFASWAS